jgi:hypothetical protein
MKANEVNTFMTKFNFNDEWSTQDLKDGIRSRIGETPAIKVNYKKDLLINEVKGTAEEINKIESIDVVFTDTDEKFKKLSFKMDV